MDDLKKLMIGLSCQINILDCKMGYLTQAIETNITAFCSKTDNEKVRKWFKGFRDLIEQSCNNIKTEYKKLYPEVFGDENGGSEL